MKKIVAFDTNVILNAAMGRDGSEMAQELIQSVVDGDITGMVTANSITDIHFIVKKRLGDEKARLVVYNVLALFDIASVDGDACSIALNTEMKDYEDAILAVCAAREGADYIATNDEGLIAEKGCPIAALRPDEILRLLKEAGD